MDGCSAISWKRQKNITMVMRVVSFSPQFTLKSRSIVITMVDATHWIKYVCPYGNLPQVRVRVNRKTYLKPSSRHRCFYFDQLVLLCPMKWVVDILPSAQWVLGNPNGLLKKYGTYNRSDSHNFTPSSLPESASILSNSQSPQKDRRVATRGFARNASCDPKTSQVTSDAEGSTSIRSR